MLDDKGFSEETCIRCGWRMGQPALNCQNDDTPHRFPSQERLLSIAEHLFQMIPQNVWREHGAEWMGQYEGDYHVEKVREELAKYRDQQSYPREYMD